MTMQGAQPGQRRALLLVNRRARRGEQWAQHAHLKLQSAGFTLITPHEDEQRSYSELIIAHQHEVDMVIVGGGDGTLNAAAQGLLQCDLPLGILPLGTANDFARTLGIPPQLDAAIDIIVAAQTRRIDLGEVNGHLFLNVSSVGFSASLARNLTSAAKKKWGTLGYALAALRLLRQSRPFSATLQFDGQQQAIKTVQFSVGNGRFYGGGMTIEKDAAPDDGRLDAYSLEVRHWWQMLALFPSLRRGTHGRWGNVRTLSGTEFILNTRRPHDINADGEIIGRTPAHYRLIARALEVFAPGKV
ncbi:lipid kinase [Pantoea rodasii]|uniref:Lipid kinase n=1 Tax=Pantoea rodasii TaxID=1076549 RepID=A0A0B1R8F0_9GAMM|nr:lipid kinase [Pantoea rodasii]KHJ67941.1 lipid kinase [Pantoea rodasii]